MALHFREASARHVRASIRCCLIEDLQANLDQVLEVSCLRV